MSIETEEQFRTSAREREPSREQKEGKESEVDEELKRGAAMERADFLTKEVKQSQQQMQNIVINMQQVMAAIRALREELALADMSDPASVARDKERITKLKKKIEGHKQEILDMREDLIQEQMDTLKEDGFVGSDEARQAKAEKMISELIQHVTHTT